jgi:glycosyltransferase involved in cell wall biosynthesis
VRTASIDPFCVLRAYGDVGEAGLAGLPVVCTDVGASREVVSEGDTVFGRVVPPRNSAALGRAILEVCASVRSCMCV